MYLNVKFWRCPKISDVAARSRIFVSKKTTRGRILTVGAIKHDFFNEESIMENLSFEGSSLRDLISKMGITAMVDSRNLQIQLRKIETNGKICIENHGKKYFFKNK